jgi:hypothetical protein
VAKYRSALPQLGGDFFMTDGGLETTLIFLEGQDLGRETRLRQRKSRRSKHQGRSPDRGDP